MSDNEVVIIDGVEVPVVAPTAPGPDTEPPEVPEVPRTPTPRAGSAPLRQAIILTVCGIPQNAAIFGPGGGQQWIGLHTSDPGTTGAGASALARLVTTWNQATLVLTGSQASITGNAVTFLNVPVGVYTHYGVYNGLTGTFIYGNALTPTITVPANNIGTITVTPKFELSIF